MSHIVKVESGPWGVVRAHAYPSKGFWSVLVWVNGEPRPPVHNLDRDDAVELVNEVVIDLSRDLQNEFEHKQHKAEVSGYHDDLEEVPVYRDQFAQDVSGQVDNFVRSII